eukprot:7922457-Lingulodinium_polyedra.AAC.1
MAPKAVAAGTSSGAGAGSRKRGQKGQEPSHDYLKQAIAKTIREQFKQLNDHEIYSKLHEDKTLYDRLWHDRREWVLKTPYGQTLKLHC